MATRITQRLIAAGASPERAAAFEKQFIAARPGLKPQDIQDAFDSELGAYAAAKYPNMWRPSTMTDTQLVDYYIGTKGQQKYDDLTKNIFSRLAPTYNTALKAQNVYLSSIAKDIKSGAKTLPDIIETIRQDAETDEEIFGGLTEDDIIKQVNTIHREYNAANTAASSIAKTELSKDKYFKANLPDPKLKYGQTTDLRAGTIDFRTNPQVETVRSKVLGAVGKMQQQLPQGFRPGSTTADRAERMAIQQGRQVSQQPIDDAIFKSLSGSKATPFFVEVKVRENLKGKTTLP